MVIIWDVGVNFNIAIAFTECFEMTLDRFFLNQCTYLPIHKYMGRALNSIYS